jgi:hypothetical protein
MGNFRFGSTHVEVRLGRPHGDEGCVHEYDRESRVIDDAEPDSFLGAPEPALHS